MTGCVHLQIPSLYAHTPLKLSPVLEHFRIVLQILSWCQSLPDNSFTATAPLNIQWTVQWLKVAENRKGWRYKSSCLLQHSLLAQKSKPRRTQMELCCFFQIVQMLSKRCCYSTSLEISHFYLLCLCCCFFSPFAPPVSKTCRNTLELRLSWVSAVFFFFFHISGIKVFFPLSLSLFSPLSLCQLPGCKALGRKHPYRISVLDSSAIPWVISQVCGSCSVLTSTLKKFTVQTDVQAVRGLRREDRCQPAAETYGLWIQQR